MPSLILGLSLLTMAPADDLEALQGEWRGPNGTTLLIVENRVKIFNRQEEFAGRLMVRLGHFQVVVGGEVVVRAPYKLTGDRLTLIVDGHTVEYQRRLEARAG